MKELLITSPFAVACVSLILSIAIYYTFRSTFRHVEGGSKDAGKSSQKTGSEEISAAETKERIIALCLVFAVVIFFWMAFHQNGLTLTMFADEFTAKSSVGLESMAFDVTNLLLCIFIVYALFSLVQSKTGKRKGSISALVIVAAIGGLIYKYSTLPESTAVAAPILPAIQSLFCGSSYSGIYCFVQLFS